MKKAKAIGGVLTVLVVAPIWYYLMYQILKRVDASELMWFLFWVYVPVAMVGNIITAIAGATEKS